MIESLDGLEAEIAFSLFKHGETIRSCAKKHNVRMQDVLEAEADMFKVFFSKENRAKMRKIIINEYPGVDKNRLRLIETQYLSIENPFKGPYEQLKNNLENRRKRYD